MWEKEIFLFLLPFLLDVDQRRQKKGGGKREEEKKGGKGREGEKKEGRGGKEDRRKKRRYDLT